MAFPGAPPLPGLRPPLVTAKRIPSITQIDVNTGHFRTETPAPRRPLDPITRGGAASLSESQLA